MLLTAQLSIGGQNTPTAVIALGTRWNDFLYLAYSGAYLSTSLTPTPPYLGLSSASASTPDPELQDALVRMQLSVDEVRHLASRDDSDDDHPLVSFARTAKRADDPLQVSTNVLLPPVAANYNSARAAIWGMLASLVNVPGYQSTFPIICVGAGPAAQIAQLAAVDLRPGQTGPNGATQTSPASDIACYAYSVAPFGDATFTTRAMAAVPGIFAINTVNALGGQPVDLWPGVMGFPVNSLLGTPEAASVPSDPNAACPWYSRTPAAYGEAFGYGVPQPAGAGSFTAPSGFNVPLAASLSQLGLTTYAQCTNPDGSVTLPSPYVSSGIVTPSTLSWTNTPWAALYVNPASKSLVISIRGPMTMAETININGNGYPVRPTWLTTGRIGDGVLAMATALAGPLATALSGTTIPATVYYTGHDFGAAVAAVLAYMVQSGVVSNLPSASAVYGFGCQPFGDYVFCNTVYPTALKAVTFQVQRPNDILTTRTGSGYTMVAGTSVSLNGGLLTTANSTTYHSMALYSQLLSAGVSA
ncbi:MAG: lipase family protein [Bacteroidota bacterium]